MSTGLKTAWVIILVGGGPEEPVGDAIASAAYVGFLATAVFIAVTTPQRTAALKSFNSSTNSSNTSNSQANTSSNQARSNHDKPTVKVDEFAKSKPEKAGEVKGAEHKTGAR